MIKKETGQVFYSLLAEFEKVLDECKVSKLMRKWHSSTFEQFRFKVTLLDTDIVWHVRESGSGRPQQEYAACFWGHTTGHIIESPHSSPQKPISFLRPSVSIFPLLRR